MRLHTPATWAALALAACGEPPTSVDVQPEFAVAAAAAPVPFHEVDMSGFSDRNLSRYAAVTGSTSGGALLVTYQATGDTSRQVLRNSDETFEALLDPDGSPRIFSAKMDSHGDLAGSYGDPFAASAFARIHGVDAVISVPDASIRTVAGLGGDSLVAGSYRDDWSGETRAFVWSTNAGVSPLPILGTPPAVGAVYSYVGAVNDRGMVLGWQWRSEFLRRDVQQ